MPDIVVDMSRGDGGDSNQSCWGFVLPCFLFLGSRSARWLTSSEGESKRRNVKKKKKVGEKKTVSEQFAQQSVCMLSSNVMSYSVADLTLHATG